jgi:hypothetical protein
VLWSEVLFHGLLWSEILPWATLRGAEEYNALDALYEDMNLPLIPSFFPINALQRQIRICIIISIINMTSLTEQEDHTEQASTLAPSTSSQQGPDNAEAASNTRVPEKTDDFPPAQPQPPSARASSAPPSTQDFKRPNQISPSSNAWSAFQIKHQLQAGYLNGEDEEIPWWEIQSPPVQECYRRAIARSTNAEEENAATAYYSELPVWKDEWLEWAKRKCTSHPTRHRMLLADQI